MNKTQIKTELKNNGYKDLLTVRECASIFDTSPTHIYKKIKAGRIPASDGKMTGKILIHLDDIAESLATEREE